MRVLLASPYKGSGGITRWTENIMAFYWNSYPVAVDLDLLPMDRHPFPNRFMRYLWGLWDYAGVILKEWWMIRSHQYNVLHLCSSGSLGFVRDYVMLKLAKQYHVHTILHFHFGRIPSIINDDGKEGRRLRKVMTLTDAAIAIDNLSYQALISAGYENIRYLPNPLASKVEQFVKEHSQTVYRDEHLILYAGHCYASKGVYDLVEACKGIENIRLVLAGTISKTVEMDLKRIASNGNWLEILGECSHDEVLTLMAQCGIFVLPSYTEGFPNVILESMACGCAIIATTVGAVSEMIGEENGFKCGLLIPPGNVDDLKNAILQFLNNEQLKYDCRVNAVLRVTKRYGIEQVWDDLESFWQKM